GPDATWHIAPFGERFPLKEHIPFIRNVNFGEGEWTPGTDTVLFRLDTLAFANLICFESIFPEITRSQARRGADFFVNITNDGWFGRSGAARQHADMAVIRAVETRRAIARCANSGISMFIMPDGAIRKPTPLYQQVVIMEDIPVMGGTTFYSRFGDLFLLLVMLLFAGSLAVAAFKPRP
ncbi:MAG: apolipoprotein N-acyltransferase, partial [Candidatus Edwardsbacteria bacterium]|nr:apolipoprotein N-acyltransferase [Candidatus Edwardsbacteria bacterium]